MPRTTDSTHASRWPTTCWTASSPPSAPNQKWAADITYVPTDEGWLYLAGVIDCFSRKIVGWSMADHMRDGPGRAMR